nr:sugar phosphate nucleotidyltransferase [Thalassobaculum salexigens]
MTTLDSILLSPDALVREALTQIDVGASQLAIVVDDDRRVLGMVTDGDVRRGLLAGVTLDDTVEKIMNRNPKLVPVDASDDEIQALMRREVIHQVPIVDSEGRIVALRTIDTFVAAERLENKVVLMAGGLGKRLRPLTETVPKPMLPVGGRPLLETLVQSFVDQGFYRFEFSVNYRAEAIEAHFSDGYRFGAEIGYLRETDALGTAGSLSLMKNRPDSPFFVMNGDILTSINFRHMLDFHRESGASATMAVFEKGFDIPYGVVDLDRDLPLVLHHMNDAQSLIGKRHVHHRSRMTFCRRQIDQAAACDHVNSLTAPQLIFLNKISDRADFFGKLFECRNIDFHIKVPGICNHRTILHHFKVLFSDDTCISCYRHNNIRDRHCLFKRHNLKSIHHCF